MNMNNELRYNGIYNVEYDANGQRMDYEKRLSKMKFSKPNYYTKIKEENRKEMRTQNTNEQLNLLDVVNRISNKIALTETQEEVNKRTIENAKEKGIAAVGQFNFEMRNLINGSGLTNTTRVETQSSEIEDDFLARTTFYPNLKANIKAPYFDESTCEWKQEGNSISANTDTISSKYLTPHRLTTQTDFSITILRQSGDFYNEVNAILVKAIYNKLVETILSDSAATDDAPKGIFNGVSATTISAITDLAEMQYNGDKQKTKNVWVISPKAKAEILKLNPLIFNDGKFLGSEYILENRMQDGLIAYLPLNLITVAQFSVVSILCDNVSDMINGNVKTYIDTYFDFDYLDNSKIQVGSFE